MKIIGQIFTKFIIALKKKKIIKKKAIECLSIYWLARNPNIIERKIEYYSKIADEIVIVIGKDYPIPYIDSEKLFGKKFFIYRINIHMDKSFTIYIKDYVKDELGIGITMTTPKVYPLQLPPDLPKKPMDKNVEFKKGDESRVKVRNKLSVDNIITNGGFSYNHIPQIYIDYLLTLRLHGYRLKEDFREKLSLPLLQFVYPYSSPNCYVVIWSFLNGFAAAHIPYPETPKSKVYDILKRVFTTFLRSLGYDKIGSSRITIEESSS